MVASGARKNPKSRTVYILCNKKQTSIFIGIKHLDRSYHVADGLLYWHLVDSLATDTSVSYDLSDGYKHVSVN